jgi:hypothetical protein
VCKKLATSAPAVSVERSTVQHVLLLLLLQDCGWELLGYGLMASAVVLCKGLFGAGQDSTNS